MISSTPAALRSRPTPRAPLRAATLQPQPQPLGPHAELLVHYTRITERGGEGVPLGIKPLDRKLKHTCLIATVSSALAALAALCGHPLQPPSPARFRGSSGSGQRQRQGQRLPRGPEAEGLDIEAISSPRENSGRIYV